MHIHKIDTFSGHRDSVYTIISDGSPEGFFSAGGDGFIIHWNLQKPDLGKLVARAGVSVYALGHDQERNQLWIGQNYEGIQLLDLNSGVIEKTSKITAAAIFDIQIWNGLAFIGLGDGVLIVMDIETFSIKKHIKLSDKSIRSIAINPIDNEIIAGDSNHLVHVLDLDSFTLKQSIQSHTNSVFSVQFSPDYQYLFSMGRDAHLKIWNPKDRYSLVADIPAHMYAINHLCFSPDGKLFATCSMDKSIKLWDSNTFKLKKIIDRARHAGHGTSINKILWTSYDNQLVSCSDDRTISIWAISE